MKIEFGSLIQETSEYEQKFLKAMKEKYQFLVGKYFGVINSDCGIKEYKGKIEAVDIHDSLYINGTEDLYFELEIKYKIGRKSFYYYFGEDDDTDILETIVFADSKAEVELELELTEF